MSLVDPVTTVWLKSEALYVTADGVPATWGDRATSSSIVSPLIASADAQVEAIRQASFVGPPMVVDLLEVDGLRIDLLGQAVTLIADRAGYQAGAVVFVIGVVEQDEVERSRLTVLRRLT